MENELPIVERLLKENQDLEEKYKAALNRIKDLETVIENTFEQTSDLTKLAHYIHYQN